jgi:hypothetical protein
MGERENELFRVFSKEEGKMAKIIRRNAQHPWP